MSISLILNSILLSISLIVLIVNFKNYRRSTKFKRVVINSIDKAKLELTSKLALCLSKSTDSEWYFYDLINETEIKFDFNTNKLIFVKDNISFTEDSLSKWKYLIYSLSNIYDVMLNPSSSTKIKNKLIVSDEVINKYPLDKFDPRNVIRYLLDK